MSASFEEKSVWLQLFSTLTVLGMYFAVAGRMLANGVTTLWAYVPLFGSTILLLTVVLVAGHIAAAVLSRPDDADERDLLIVWRAESKASWILAAGAFAAIGCLLVSVEAVWIAHLLLLSVLLSAVVGYVLQLVYYRRGMQP